MYLKWNQNKVFQFFEKLTSRSYWLKTDLNDFFKKNLVLRFLGQDKLKMGQTDSSSFIKI